MPNGMNRGTTATNDTLMGLAAKQSGSAAARILLVDDEPKLRESLAEGLRMEDWQVATAATGQEALCLLESQEFDLLLLDWMLPDRNGIEILRHVRGQGKQVPVLFVTARSADHDRVEAVQNGANGYLMKPFAFEDLLARCRALLAPT
jgi:DNA-binding response OmpR family regulator